MKIDRPISEQGAWGKVTGEVRELHQLEHAGESQYTPLLAIAGLVVFLFVVLGIVLAVSLLALHVA
jgi:hypothetical protein